MGNYEDREKEINKLKSLLKIQRLIYEKRERENENKKQKKIVKANDENDDEDHYYRRYVETEILRRDERIRQFINNDNNHNHNHNHNSTRQRTKKQTYEKRNVKGITYDKEREEFIFRITTTRKRIAIAIVATSLLLSLSLFYHFSIFYSFHLKK